MINPMIPGLRAVRLDGKTHAETLWKVVVGPLEDQYQPAVRIAPGGSDVAYDLVGDGRPMLAASIANERGDGKQRLALFDARTGKRLWEGGDARILAVDDLDGDGRWEVLFGDRHGLHALGERGRKPRLLWTLPFDRTVGEPILADADGDGRAEILVPVEDGQLYCLRGGR
jgi:hypothetical protein